MPAVGLRLRSNPLAAPVLLRCCGTTCRGSWGSAPRKTPDLPDWLPCSSSAGTRRSPPQSEHERSPHACHPLTPSSKVKATGALHDPNPAGCVHLSPILPHTPPGQGPHLIHVSGSLVSPTVATGSLI